MAFFHPRFGPHPSQYFVPGSPFAGYPIFPGRPYPTYPRYGKVVYKYHTPDGGPPNMGEPPKKPKEGGIGSNWPFGGTYSNTMLPSVPHAMRHASEPAPQPDLKKKVSSCSCDPKINIRIFQNNFLDNELAALDDQFEVPEQANIIMKRFPRDTTIAELIEQIDCLNGHNSDYPQYGIGIQEVLPAGRNRYRVGSRIMLDSPRARSKIGDVWPRAHDNASQDQMPHVVRWPGCK